MKGPLGHHLGKTLELRTEGDDSSISVSLKCLRYLVRDFENERRLLIKLSDTGRVVVAIQHCLESALDILNLQETEESFTWRNAFQQERNEWMESFKLLLASRWKMKIEIGGKRQRLEVMTRLKYGIERYGDVLTCEEKDVMSDVLKAVGKRSNTVDIPKWFKTSKHDWPYSRTTRVYGTDRQIANEVDVWANLHHPHIRQFFGACHVGKKAFVIHDEHSSVYYYYKPWRSLVEIARGLEYVHGCGLAHRRLTDSNLLLSTDNRGILSGLGLVRQSDILFSSRSLRLCGIETKQQPSPERDICAFGLCIFDLLNPNFVKCNRVKVKQILSPKRLPSSRPDFIDEEEWELLSLMCSSNPEDRIEIRDVIYRMGLLADREDNKRANNSSNDLAERVEVVEKLGLFMVNTLDLTLEAALREVEVLHADLPDFNAVNQPVLSRLQDVFSQLEAATNPLPLDVVESFSLILIRFYDSLDRHGLGGGSLVASVCASRSITTKNYSIHRDLDRLIQSTSLLQSDFSIHDWLPHFQEIQELQRSTLQGYLDKPLPTSDGLGKDSSDDGVLLEYLKRNHANEFAGIGASNTDTSLFPMLPKWFIPPHQVEFGRHIADGSFGSVYEGKWLGTDVVLKQVTTDQGDAENRKQFLREVDLWFSLSDGFLTKLYGACHVGQPFFVCERAVGGTLVDFAKKGMAIWERWACIYKAALGLQYLHNHGIIHGDLKGNNILIGDNLVKLCDFGLASLASSNRKQLTIDDIGAIRWKAPECLLGNGPTFASDIYSFGMCIIEILTGQYPWGDTMPDSTVKLKVTQKEMLPLRPDCMGHKERSLITRMSCFDPEQRIKIGGVVNVVTEILEQFRNG
ncbi:Serine/threonine-protein kinase STY46 [Phytophthora citrophthora]|uniref:Serine/threonine-protein kinase STY46 n=1 Tax=Phytophthora citrophthora TaxID=4793 RepID=A0AAD9LKE7_9STRA|nr:Serine/threonine-protein kinase STY46 [Phytophthora citrophthora]